MTSAVAAPRRERTAPPFGRIALLAALTVVAAVLLSLAVGTRSVPLEAVWTAFAHPDPDSADQAAVLSRLPATASGLLVGAALGMGGALMQGMARNPLADPGLLGVNAGASLFVVLGMAALGLRSPFAIVWLALLGAAVAVAVGYTAAAAAPGGATPVSLALTGAAVTALSASAISGVLIVDEGTLDSFRFWQLGSLTAASPRELAQLAGFLAAGTALAVLCSGRLNALALGDDVARGLGVHVALVRLLSAAAVVLLCGTATALAGPIGFVGLAVPHAVRFVAGTDYRRIVPLSAAVGGVFLLVCDVVGRVLARPGLLEVGIVTAAVGAPIFIVLLRRNRAVGV